MVGNDRAQCVLVSSQGHPCYGIVEPGLHGKRLQHHVPHIRFPIHHIKIQRIEIHPDVRGVVQGEVEPKDKMVFVALEQHKPTRLDRQFSGGVEGSNKVQVIHDGREERRGVCLAAVDGKTDILSVKEGIGDLDQNPRLGRPDTGSVVYRALSLFEGQVREVRPFEKGLIVEHIKGNIGEDA